MSENVLNRVMKRADAYEVVSRMFAKPEDGGREKPNAKLIRCLIAEARVLEANVDHLLRECAAAEAILNHIYTDDTPNELMGPYKRLREARLSQRTDGGSDEVVG